jgi:hypothetical protein
VEIWHIITSPTAYRVLGKWIAIAEKAVDGRPWYRWALERLGLKYRHERFWLEE